jgi:RNA polymerase-binding transcription factor DksA
MPAPATVEPGAGLTPRQGRELGAALDQERHQLLAQIRANEEAQRTLGIAQHEEGGPGSAPGDVASDLAEEALVATLLRADRNRLALVEGALRRLAAGSYGLCAGCGEPIRYPRLRALPWTATCRACADQPRAAVGREHEPGTARPAT